MRQLHALDVPCDAHIAIAVSGGADSVCLALLANEKYQVTALTVDHGLRDESASEAVAVNKQLSGLGIKHHVLTWEMLEKPVSNVQALAREARYNLMLNWCVESGVQFLLTAHHSDDQAETLLLRLARGSGVYGLAAMEPKRRLSENVTLVRPLLNVTKLQLMATLRERGINWIEDPSNQSQAFERIKARKLLADPPLEGLTPQRLSATASRLGRTRDALRFYEEQWLQEAVDFHLAGYARLRMTSMTVAPLEIILRGLTSVLRFAGGGHYGPRFEKLERLYNALTADAFSGCTLGGAQFTVGKNNDTWITRESSETHAMAIGRDGCFWDNRYDVSWPNNSIKSDNTLKVNALGLGHVAQVMNSLEAAGNSEKLKGLPKVVIAAMPAFFDKQGLIAVPHLGYNPTNIRYPLLTHRWLSLSKIGSDPAEKSDTDVQ